jgi:hypothetical protein
MRIAINLKVIDEPTLAGSQASPPGWPPSGTASSPFAWLALDSAAAFSTKPPTSTNTT